MGETMAFQGNLFSKRHFNGQYLGFANGSSKIKADRTITLFSPSQGVKRRGCWKIFKISHTRRFLTQFIPICEGVLSFLLCTHPLHVISVCLVLCLQILSPKKTNFKGTRTGQGFFSSIMMKKNAKRKTSNCSKGAIYIKRFYYLNI